MSETKMTLEQLQELLKGFNAADIQKAVKAVKAEKPTAMSLTMDVLVAAKLAGPVITDNVYKEVCLRATNAEIDLPSTGTVASLIRYGNEFDAALTRAGYEWSKKAEVTPTEHCLDGIAPAAEPPQSDKAPEGTSDKPGGNVAPMPRASGSGKVPENKRVA